MTHRGSAEADREAWLPRGWRCGSVLFDAPVVCEEPIFIHGRHHTHLTARKTGSHELRCAPDTLGPHRYRESATLPADFDGQVYQSEQPPEGSPGAKMRWEKVGKGGIALARTPKWSTTGSGDTIGNVDHRP
jgi:hypothetical protein